MKHLIRFAGAMTLICIGLPAQAQQPAADSVPVTVDTFARAETDRYLAENAALAGGLGRFHHARAPAAIDNQTVIRMNRDTLYSFAVVDLAAGPVAAQMPDAGKRFMSMMIVDEDHYVPWVAYDSRPHELTQQAIGTRYAFIAIRTLFNPDDPGDLAAVHRLQDAITLTQKERGTLDLPKWNQADLKAIRDALLVLARYNTSFGGAFGARGQVDPIHHLIGTAAGWGGNPEKDAAYASYAVPRNDGKAVYRVDVPANVPVEAFWSISVYDAKGFFEKNPYNAYSVNSVGGERNADGSVTIQFGGCDGKIPNCLPVMDGWNYTVRMYRPGPAILDGSWKFPAATQVN